MRGRRTPLGRQREQPRSARQNTRVGSFPARVGCFDFPLGWFDTPLGSFDDPTGWRPPHWETPLGRRPPHWQTPLGCSRPQRDRARPTDKLRVGCRHPTGKHEWGGQHPNGHGRARPSYARDLPSKKSPLIWLRSLPLTLGLVPLGTCSFSFLQRHSPCSRAGRAGRARVRPTARWLRRALGRAVSAATVADG